MTPLDRVKGALLAVIAAATAPLKYASPQLAICQSVNTDGSLELTFPNTAYPSLSHVKLYQAYPTGTTTAAAGSVVLVHWVNSDPSQPVALGFDPAQGGTVKAVVPPSSGTASLVLANGDTVTLSITSINLSGAALGIVAASTGIPAVTSGSAGITGTMTGQVTGVSPADGRTLYA